MTIHQVQKASNYAKKVLQAAIRTSDVEMIDFVFGNLQEEVDIDLLSYAIKVWVILFVVFSPA
jgi:hypothetical protein